MTVSITRLVLATGVVVAVCAPGVPDAMRQSSRHGRVSGCWCCPRDGLGARPNFAVAPVLGAQAGSDKAEWSKESKAALDRLIEGNERFAAGKSLHKLTSAAWRARADLSMDQEAVS